jgi:hypothetical protein
LDGIEGKHLEDRIEEEFVASNRIENGYLRIFPKAVEIWKIRPEENEMT